MSTRSMDSMGFPQYRDIFRKEKDRGFAQSLARIDNI
jgi:hypothetical protein